MQCLDGWYLTLGATENTATCTGITAITIPNTLIKLSYSLSDLMRFMCGLLKDLDDCFDTLYDLFGRLVLGYRIEYSQ